MSEQTLIISPKTKVGELLDAFPQLESVLLELSPSFSKLKNPILRKTVARVASLQQAAMVGGLKVDELVNRLRKEVGQDSFSGNIENNEYILSQPPTWFDPTKVTVRFDASPIINAGNSPMNEILSLVSKLQPKEILEIKTPFVPAPIIDIIKKKGCKLFSQKKDNDFIYTYISR